MGSPPFLLIGGKIYTLHTSLPFSAHDESKISEALQHWKCIGTINWLLVNTNFSSSVLRNDTQKSDKQQLHQPLLHISSQ